MTVVYTKQGRQRDLDDINSFTEQIILWKNNITPTVDTVYADLVVADFSGYSLALASWGTDTINGDGNAETVAATATFTRGVGATSNDIYGWALVRFVSTVGKLIYIERYSDAPRAMNTVGNSISETITKTQGGCP